MLSEKFLARLGREFPSFYERVNQEAMQEAGKLRAEAGGDVQKALLRARFQSAGRLWIPYVKGTLPLMGNDRPAMEEFTRLVLVVDHVVGFVPPSMEAARSQVVDVLRHSVDYERLQAVFERENKQAAAKAGAAAGAGLMATLAPFLTPLSLYRRARRGFRLMPVPLRVVVGAAIVATLLSVPLIAGYTAGLQAEKAAKNFGELPATTETGTGVSTGKARPG